MFVWLDRKTLWRLYLTTKEKEWQMMEKIKTDCIWQTCKIKITFLSMLKPWPVSLRHLKQRGVSTLILAAVHGNISSSSYDKNDSRNKRDSFLFFVFQSLRVKYYKQGDRVNETELAKGLQLLRWHRKQIFVIIEGPFAVTCYFAMSELKFRKQNRSA